MYCYQCLGTGKIREDRGVTCSHCNGNKLIPFRPGRYIRCPKCNGKGFVPGFVIIDCPSNIHKLDTRDEEKKNRRKKKKKN